VIPKVEWPEGKQFAFTIFDDPDGFTEPTKKWVYPILADLGFRTTIAVWPNPIARERNSEGDTCADPAYLAHLHRMQALGFEISYHNAAPHNSTREEIAASLERFREYFGAYPRSVANHYNADALYWGAERLTDPLCRTFYKLMTRNSTAGKHSGEVESSPYFWGDLCLEKTQYFRNFVFRDINTLKACPFQPYHNPQRRFVREWFACSEGDKRPAFVRTIAEANQDRLEDEGGMSLMYTHLAHGFADDNGLNPEFKRLMIRLSKKNAWFGPVSTILDHLRATNGAHTVTSGELSSMEWKWLFAKALHGTS